jgi:hypothetical protein
MEEIVDKKSSGRGARTRVSLKSQASVAEDIVAETVDAVVEDVVTGSDNYKKPIVPKEIDPNQIVTVRNGFQGRLVYKGRRTGERFVWDAFGSEQDMELSELKNAKSSNKKYFINNWFMFDESWIVDYLGLKQYYKNAIPIQDFDKLFEKPVSEIEETISQLSDGQKKSIAYRAKQLIAEGGIDSNRTIATLEKCLGTELVER